MNQKFVSLIDRILNEAIETLSGRIRFSKELRELFRKETGDYKSCDMVITGKMIDAYNKNLKRR